MGFRVRVILAPKSEEIVDSLSVLEKELDSATKDKETCLNILRNPETIAENSLSLRRDRQADLIQSFDCLVKIIESKQSHIGMVLCETLENFH